MCKNTTAPKSTRLEKRNSLYFSDKQKKINGKITKRVFKLSLGKSEDLYNTLHRKKSY